MTTKVRQIGFVCLLCRHGEPDALNIDSAAAIVEHIEKAHPHFVADFPDALELLRQRAEWLDFVTRMFDGAEAAVAKAEGR